MMFRVELEEKDVENEPPKRRLELEGFRVIVDTGPLRPVKGIDCQDEDDVDQRATFDPFPLGPVNSPPIQISFLSESQDRAFTGPATPDPIVFQDDVDIEYEATFGVLCPPIDVKDPPTYNVPFPSPDTQQTSFILPPALVTPIGLYPPSPLRRNTVSPSEENFGVEEDDEVEAKALWSDHQSRPANDPPSPTVPIREKSTAGREAGAGVAASAGMMKGRSIARSIG